MERKIYINFLVREINKEIKKEINKEKEENVFFLLNYMLKL